jgi:hypothetical protein
MDHRVVRMSTQAQLPPAARDKFLRICGMLGSAFDGERASAALLASRMLKDAGLAWVDVVCIPEMISGLRQGAPRRDRDADPFGGRDWRYIATRCRQFPHLIDAWEDRFLADVPRRSMMTAKQSAKLVAISAMLRAVGCAI